MSEPSSLCRECERFTSAQLSVDAFRRDYERYPGKPVNLVDCASEWPAFAGGASGAAEARGWTLQSFSGRFGRAWFRFDDLHGEEIRFEEYEAYTRATSADAPLAIYDSQFGEPEEDEPDRTSLVADYDVPVYFAHDMFDVVCTYSINEAPPESESSDSHRRPPFRWILVGPARSGTGLHIDPLHTSAWVTLLQGVKRWCLFNPSTPHDLIGFHPDGPKKLEAVHWYRRYHPACSGARGWPPGVPPPVEVVQRPGETVYVPAGWIHLVLNLTATVSVTHNYASPHGGRDGVRAIWRDVAVREASFGRRWVRALERHLGAGDLEWPAEQVLAHVGEEHASLLAAGVVDWPLPAAGDDSSEESESSAGSDDDR